MAVHKRLIEFEPLSSGNMSSLEVDEFWERLQPGDDRMLNLRNSA